MRLYGRTVVAETLLVEVIAEPLDTGADTQNLRGVSHASQRGRIGVRPVLASPAGVVCVTYGINRAIAEEG